MRARQCQICNTSVELRLCFFFTTLSLSLSKTQISDLKLTLYFCYSIVGVSIYVSRFFGHWPISLFTLNWTPYYLVYPHDHVIIMMISWSFVFHVKLYWTWLGLFSLIILLFFLITIYNYGKLSELRLDLYWQLVVEFVFTCFYLL